MHVVARAHGPISDTVWSVSGTLVGTDSAFVSWPHPYVLGKTSPNSLSLVLEVGECYT